MQSSSSIPPTSAESIVINELPSQNPTTLLLRTNRPYLYNTWALNNRLRLKNEKLSKRQQSSCRIAFYSLWLCVSAGVMIIVIYRFTDECSLAPNPKQFFIKCLRHWLFLAAICTSLLACGGVIFGACRFFRSQKFNFLYDEQHELQLTNNNGLLPMNITPHSYYYPTSLTNGVSIVSSRQLENHDSRHSNTTVISSITNASSRRKIPPFNYDELLPESNSITISKSPNIDNNNKTILFSSSTSTLSLPQSIVPTPRTSNTTINSNKSKATSIFEDTCSSTPAYTTCLCGANVWEKQQKLSSSRH
jgi:hypothetical protein